MIDPITQQILELDRIEKMSNIILETKQQQAYIDAGNRRTQPTAAAVSNIAVYGTMALIAAITAGGYLLYKKHLSQAARDCDHRAGQAKEICMLQHRIDGMAEQGNKLIQGKKYCKQSKEPQKCIDLIDTKVNQIKKKIEKTAQKAGYAAQQYKRKMKSK